MGQLKLLRIDAAWDNEGFLAEAEAVTEEGETVYAAVTDRSGLRTYRLLRNSAYDDAFCRVERIGITEKDVIRSFPDLPAARKEDPEVFPILGVLDNAADDCESLTEYHWQPGAEEDPYGARAIAGAEAEI